jgi:hypothetical protein
MTRTRRARSPPANAQTGPCEFVAAEAERGSNPYQLRNEVLRPTSALDSAQALVKGLNLPLQYRKQLDEFWCAEPASLDAGRTREFGKGFLPSPPAQTSG